MGNITNNFSVDDIHLVREEYARKFENMTSVEISEYVKDKIKKINEKYNLKLNKQLEYV